MALLEGKTAVVTGGAQGIGLEIARTFIAEGARVVIGDINDEAGAAAVAELGGEDSARYIRCDVRDGAAVEAMIDGAEEAFGPLGVFVNNAGVTRDATMRKMTEQQFDDIISIHLKGTWNGTRAAAGRMREHGGGAIVNLSSISGKVGLVGQTNYSAAKAGIQGMTKTYAIELGKFGVTANAIAPGFIETDMTKATAERVGIDFEDFVKGAVAQIPVARSGKPEDIAHTASFLASEGAGFVSGQVIYVAGGPKA